MHITNRLCVIAGLGFALVACGDDEIDTVTGPQGPQGPAGAQGPQGDRGQNGQDGRDGRDGAGAVREIVFEGVQVPVTDAEKRGVLAASKVTVDGESADIGFHTIVRSGQMVGGNQFGALVDENGNVLTEEDGSTVIANSTDFSSIIRAGDKLYNITHLESRPGAMYLTELAQGDDGILTPVSTQPIDFSSVGGLWVPCAGSVTPWNSHLGSEEYPADGRYWEGMTSPSDIGSYWGAFMRYWGITWDDPNTTLGEINAVFNPYAYGYPVEVSVDGSGNVTVGKHYAMGRVALELAYVMPDQRTAYLSDDGTNVGFYMFVADNPGDMSAGTLYGVKLYQTSPDGAGNFTADVDWIDMGHATNAEIQAMIDSGTTFSDIFNSADPTLDNDGNFVSCPSGYTSLNTEAGVECLQLVNGMEKAASRLETRRYLGYLGGTTEFRKEEGIAFDAKSKTLFVAMSEVERGMEDFARSGSTDLRYDRGGPNDIRTAYNDCGAVYGLKLYPDGEIGSDYVAQSWKTVVEGTMISYPAGSAYENNSCSVNGIANPDNVTFFPGFDVLVIGEDSGRGHQNDAIWTYDMRTGDLTRIQSTPYGSETTSPYVYPNINGWGYMMSVIQHPFGESDRDQLMDPAEAAAYVGFIGPLPALD